MRSKKFKILIIRFSSIGDIVLTTPVIRCLKQQQPDIEIHYLTKNTFKGILEDNPYVTKIHSIEKDITSSVLQTRTPSQPHPPGVYPDKGGGHLLHLEKGSGSSLREVIANLKNENFDFIVDLHHNIRSAQVKMALGKPSSSFKKLNFKKWLLVNFKINKMPAIHIVDRYMQTVESLDVKNDYKGLDYFIPHTDEVGVSTLPASHQRGYIGFVVGAKHFTKQLPTEKIISICKKINQPIILLGGKADKERAEAIKKAVGGNIYNACGKYNLNQSASLIKQATEIISHDTGLMHIAAAFKKEIISVWGNTVPAFGFTPYLPDAKSKIVEVQNLSCRPCSKIGYDKCPKGHFKCMMQIDESEFV